MQKEYMVFQASIKLLSLLLLLLLLLLAAACMHQASCSFKCAGQADPPADPIRRVALLSWRQFLFMQPKR